jgi:hypothetical protein
MNVHKYKQEEQCTCGVTYIQNQRLKVLEAENTVVVYQGLGDIDQAQNFSYAGRKFKNSILHHGVCSEHHCAVHLKS